MSANNTSDIDPLISELEHLRLNINDRALGSGFWDEAVKDFIARHSTKMIGLMEELRKTRGQILVRQPSGQPHSVTVEGHSHDTPRAALSAALNKALLYTSKGHELILVLKDIGKVSQEGHHARMELHVMPAGAGAGQDEKLAGMKHTHDHDYGRKHGRHHGDYPVFNHFAGLEDDGSADLPEYILVNVPDRTVMNYMISNRFFDSGRQPWPGPDPGQPFPDKMIVRVRHPHMAVSD